MGHTNLLQQKTFCRMTKEEISLLHLLQLGLSGKIKESVIDIKYDIDWHSVYALALRQGITAIQLDAISKLPNEARPSKPVLLQWIGQATMMERMYARHKERIASLAELYGQQGIRMLLLKGYGCSLCYPKPDHRPTGDIDVYLFGKQD